MKLERQFGLRNQEINIVSAGTTVGHCKAAIEMLQDKGVEVGLLNMHTIKPLDTKALETCIQSSQTLITVEEHTIIGGLGSAILEHVTKKNLMETFLFME